MSKTSRKRTHSGHAAGVAGAAPVPAAAAPVAATGEAEDTAGAPPPAGGTPIDPADIETAEAMLTQGRLTVEGRLAAASNATLYCSLEWEGLTAACVYKPVAGERPLWDFPDGTLAGREVAAYLVSKTMGWRIVPPTVHRDGPYGPGMVQLWIDTDESTDVV